jgi:hypothetical protein
MQRQSFSEVQENDKMIKRSNEIINEDLVDDTENNLDENDDTSEAEKNSGSDEEEEDEKEVKEPSPKASPDVRKRRTRKAD